MWISEVIDEKQEIDEIKTIRHDPQDDKELTQGLFRFVGHTKQPGRSLKKIGSLPTLDIWTENPNLVHRYFFLDKNGEPKGFANLKRIGFLDDRGNLDQSSNVYKIGLIYLVPEARGHGDGLAFYRFLLDRGIKLESDRHQTKFSQGIWIRLSKMSDYQIDVVNADGETIDADISSAYSSDGYLIAYKI